MHKVISAGRPKLPNLFSLYACKYSCSCNVTPLMIPKIMLLFNA